MGEASHNFLPFIEHVLWDPFLCEWGKYRTKPRPLELMLFSLSRSQNLHITPLPQEVLFGYLPLSQKGLHFNMDALERPVRTGAASEGLGGEWEPSRHSAYHAALANCILTPPLPGGGPVGRVRTFHGAVVSVQAEGMEQRHSSGLYIRVLVPSYSPSWADAWGPQ